MKRRTVELIMAMALGTMGAMVVLTPSDPSPLPSARALRCEPAAPDDAAASSVTGTPNDAASASPARPDDAGLRDVWAGVSALGYVRTDAIRRVEVMPGQPTEVELVLTPSPHACGELVDGRCAAGCFEIMAAAGFEGSLELEVSPPQDPTDVIAASLEPGGVVAAGHCRGFALGHAGIHRVRVRVSASSGQGPVELAAWRHPDPQGAFSAGLTLRMPPPGTPREQVLADIPECLGAMEEDASRDQCRFHGSVGPLPLSDTCQDGCTRWMYRFDDDRLVSAELRRMVADVDDTFVGEFTDEAVWIAAALDRALGSSGRPESLHTWAEVESPTAEQGEPIVLQRRTWARPEATTTWQLVGTPGHHAVIELQITTTEPE